MIVCGTGHRPTKLNNEWDGIGPMSGWIRQETKKILLDLKPDKVISGMALGFDMLLAEVAIDLGIPLVAAIPCLNQDKMWVQKSRDRYKSILTHAVEEVIVTNTEYTGPKLMMDRNKWMVDAANVVIACYNGDKTGGTANCVNYARQQKKVIVTINPEEFYENRH